MSTSASSDAAAGSKPLNRLKAILEGLTARESLRAGLILALLLNLCFFPCIWGKRTLLESAQGVASILPGGAWGGRHAEIQFQNVLDAGGSAWLSEPLTELVHSDYIKEKSIPLWNPYQAYGAPLAANMQSQPFYPLTIALSLDLKPKTYNLFILLRLFVAGFCAYLYLRLFVSFLAALAGGVSSMLAGYYLLYSTMPHLSVEVLLPAGLLSAEYLLRNQSYRSVIWFAIVFLLVILGGMPESSLVLLSFVYAYVLFRLVSDRRLRLAYARIAKCLLAATAAGASLSAFLLLPFMEYLRNSFNGHEPSHTGGLLWGVFHDPFGSSIFTYLFPFLFGPPYGSSGPSGTRNYFGLVAMFLVIIAIAGLLARGGKPDRGLKGLTSFFLAAVIAVLLKRYGFVLVNSIGQLPLYRMVIFPKYAEVILSMSVSVLCAIGLERLIKREMSISKQVVAIGITLLLAPLAVVCSREELHKKIVSDHLNPAMPIWALGISVAALFSLLICMLLNRQRWRAGGLAAYSGPWFPICVLVLLSAEMSLSYVVPAYYVFNKLPFRSSNPYKGAPFVSVLQSDVQQGQYRIFARRGVLAANWASAFQSIRHP